MNMVESIDIWNIVVEDFIPKLESHKGLEFFVINKSKFEGWMKVELCDSLTALSNDITPEKDRIDIVIDDFAIELKTSNTNYKTDKVLPKTKPITKNVNSIINDIKVLKKNTKYRKKSVMFIIFPLPKESENNWSHHYYKIYSELNAVFSEEFYFINGVRGMIYFGLIA